MTQIENDLTEFYRLLSDLEKGVGGKRAFESCNSKMNWPKRGVYFFFEDGEVRKTKPSLERVVRVGTHALKKTHAQLCGKDCRSIKGQQVEGETNEDQYSGVS